MNASRIIAAALCGLLCIASAQGALKPAVKGAKPGEWTYDFDAAKAVAAEKNIPIYLFYNDGGTTCPIEKKGVSNFAKRVYDSPAWTRYARENLMLVYVDVPDSGRPGPGVPPQFVDAHKTLSKFRKYAAGTPGCALVAPDGETRIADWVGITGCFSAEYLSDLIKAHCLMHGLKPPEKPAAKNTAPATAAASAIKPATEGAVPGEWTMDFDAAKKIAAENNTPILVFFTGSDWNRTAQGVVRSVFTKPGWEKFIKDSKLPLVWVDLPEDASLVPEKFAAQNAALRKEHLKPSVFPVCVLLESDGVKKLKTFDKALPVMGLRDFQDGIKFHLPK